jgi:hypothetical protein
MTSSHSTTPTSRSTRSTPRRTALTADDLSEITHAADAIHIEGGLYSEAAEQMTNL